MIHLSRFLIGIRHSRIFRMKALSGRLADKLIKAYPKDFTRVGETQFGDDIELTNAGNTLLVKATRDDVIFDGRKTFDMETRKYIEVNKQKVLDITKGCLPIVTEVFELDKDFVRIGMIFEFRIPTFVGVENDNFGKFIFDKFIAFNTNGDRSEGSMRFVYKLKVPEGGLIRNIKDYKNVIIIMNPSKGIDEDGKERGCLIISVDIQHIFDPNQKSIDVDDHYKFAVNHLKQVVLPEFKLKGVDITYE